MKTIVTSENIKSVAKNIQKIANSKTILSQTFYPTTKREKTICNNLGIDKKFITESNVSEWNTHKIETDFMFDKHFIRISNNKETYDKYGYGEFRAFIVYCGDTVEFKGNTIIIKCEHPIKRGHKSIKKLVLK